MDWKHWIFFSLLCESSSFFTSRLISILTVNRRPIGGTMWYPKWQKIRNRCVDVYFQCLPRETGSLLCSSLEPKYKNLPLFFPDFMIKKVSIYNFYMFSINIIYRWPKKFYSMHLNKKFLSLLDSFHEIESKNEEFWKFRTLCDLYNE